MDKLRALGYFLEVADTASFSRAAKTFHVSASSISRRVQDLENDLGVALFHRSTRVVKLTELGSLYVDQVRPTLAALKLADEMVGQHSKMPSGIVKITASPDFGRFRLLPALTKLRTRYPDIVCDVELTDQLSDLARNEVDIAIRATSNPPDHSVARKLADGRFILVASPDYLEEHGTPRTLAQLQDHLALLYRLPNGILHWQAKTQDNWIALRLPPAFISNQGDALLEAALAGRGLGLIPKWSIGKNLADGGLVHIVLDDADVRVSHSESSGIYLLYHRPKYVVKKIRLAIDFLLSELTES